MLIENFRKAKGETSHCMYLNAVFSFYKHVIFYNIKWENKDNLYRQIVWQMDPYPYLSVYSLSHLHQTG
jgi:hypothetical protein